MPPLWDFSCLATSLSKVASVKAIILLKNTENKRRVETDCIALLKSADNKIMLEKVGKVPKL